MSQDRVREIITLKEYERLPYELLRGSEVSRLEKIVADLGARVFRFFRNYAQAQSFVGIVKTGEHTIQILPKMYEDESDNLGFLVHLLAYTRKLELRDTGTANLEELNGSLLEIWIRHFAKELNRLLRTRPLHAYVEIEENVSFLRGKLLLEQELRGRGRLYARYPCRYTVFTASHLINEVLKFCNLLLMAQTRILRTRALLQENDSLLADVDLRTIRLRDLDRVHLNRLNRDYEPILRTCRLLLESATVDIRAGRINQLAFVFDMNMLFEEFVVEFLKRNKHKIRLEGERYLTEVSNQRPLGRLFGEFSMRVDLILTDDTGHKLLVDTKYKLLDAAAPHAGLSQTDFYQMYAYATAGKYRYQDVVLLYPGTGSVRRVFSQERLRVYVRQFDPRAIYDPGSQGPNIDALAKQLGCALSVELRLAR